MHSGNAFVVVLCALAMVMEVELRSNIAAAVQSSYGSGFASSGAGVQSGGAGLSSGSGLARTGSTVGAANYRAPTNGGSQPNGYYSRGNGYASYNHGGYSPSSGQNDEKLQKETKYYYGGKYQGKLLVCVDKQYKIAIREIKSRPSIGISSVAVKVNFDLMAQVA